VSASAGGGGEVGVGSGTPVANSNICLSISSLLNNAEAGGQSAIAVSIIAEGGDGVLGVETGVGGRSVGTSKFDGTSEQSAVEEVGGGDDVNFVMSSE